MEMRLHDWQFVCKIERLYARLQGCMQDLGFVCRKTCDVFVHQIITLTKCCNIDEQDFLSASCVVRKGIEVRLGGLDASLGVVCKNKGRVQDWRLICKIQDLYARLEACMHDPRFVLEVCMQDWRFACKIRGLHARLAGLYARLEVCMQDWRFVCKIEELNARLEVCLRLDVCMQY